MGYIEEYSEASSTVSVATTTGRDSVAEIIGGINGDDYKYLHLGGDGTEAVTGDTQLVAEFTDSGLAPALATTSIISANVLQVSHRFTATASKVIRESGIFAGVGASTMLARSSFGAISIDAGDSVTIKQTIEVD